MIVGNCHYESERPHHRVRDSACRRLESRQNVISHPDDRQCETMFPKARDGPISSAPTGSEYAERSESRSNASRLNGTCDR
jgi:hypothetical protein